jgi:hypothetical protein
MKKCNLVYAIDGKKYEEKNIPLPLLPSGKPSIAEIFTRRLKEDWDGFEIYDAETNDHIVTVGLDITSSRYERAPFRNLNTRNL